MRLAGTPLHNIDGALIAGPGIGLPAMQQRFQCFMETGLAILEHGVRRFVQLDAVWRILFHCDKNERQLDAKGFANANTVHGGLQIVVQIAGRPHEAVRAGVGALLEVEDGKVQQQVWANLAGQAGFGVKPQVRELP